MQDDILSELSPRHRRHNEYAIVIFLPTELDAIVAPLREKYDPLYNAVAAHLTLVFPFVAGESLDNLVSVVKQQLSKVSPVKIELESIGDFYPDSPCIYWDVKKNKKLHDLYFGLYSSLDLPIEHKRYVPHVTIAREISEHRVLPVKDNIALRLPSESFVCNSVDLVTPIGDRRWVSVRTIPFGG